MNTSTLRYMLPCMLAGALLAGCAQDGQPAKDPVKARPTLASEHNARNSLDWAGTYEGTLPCADCPGIRTRLELTPQGQYELQTRYLDRQQAPTVQRGNFVWQPDGSTIRLDKAGDEQSFFVAEGRLIQLYQDGSRPSGPLAPHYELKLLP